MSTRPQVETLLRAAGLSDEQVSAEPLLIKLPDAESRQNVAARFTFSDDRLTELLFTLHSDEASEVAAQVDRWGSALRKIYGSKPAEASTSPEGYRLEGWCLGTGVEVSIISKGGLAALDYVVDDFGACRDAPSLSPQAAGSFMYRLNPPASRP